jgi:hypothetical protein
VNVVTDTIPNGVDTEKLFATLDLIYARVDVLPVDNDLFRLYRLHP